MIIGRRLVVSAAALAVSAATGFAGPCSQEIERVQAAVDARLEKKAAAGPQARESPAAMEHRQPTPASIAAAESRLGDVSPRTVQAIAAALARARKADRAGNTRACTRALAQVRRALAR